ncbi:MAG: hypothetical protein ACHQNA_12795 [Acidimicrobiales bacterium]
MPVSAVWDSADGRNWVRAADPAPSFVAVGPHGLTGAFTSQLASGSPSVRFAVSADGFAWTSASGTFEADVRGLATAPDGMALAVGDVPGAPRTDGSPTTDVVVWRSDGTTWTGPEVIAHDALPLAVTADAHGFLMVALVSTLLPSGSVSDTSQVWRLADGDGPRAALIPLGDEEHLDSVFLVGDALLATGDTVVNGLANAMIWVSIDGGTTWGRVADQQAFSDINNEITGVVATSDGLLAVGSRWDSVSGHPLPEVWLAGR